jgi:hypothetical protein
MIMEKHSAPEIIQRTPFNDGDGFHHPPPDHDFARHDPPVHDFARHDPPVHDLPRHDHDLHDNRHDSFQRNFPANYDPSFPSHYTRLEHQYAANHL